MRNVISVINNRDKKMEITQASTNEHLPLVWNLDDGSASYFGQKVSAEQIASVREAYPRMPTLLEALSEAKYMGLI
jgi:hypothetical protein